MAGNGLFSGATRYPGVLAEPAAAPPRPRNAGEALRMMFGGAPDPRLSDEQNAAAGRQAMLEAGLATILASGPSAVRPGLLQALAAGALAGQQGGARARQGMAGRAAMSNPAMLAGLTPQQKAILAALPPDQQAEVLATLATREPPDPKVVAEGGVLVSPTGEKLFENLAAGPQLPGDLRAILWARGINPDAMTPEQRADVLTQYEGLKRSSSPRIQVDLNQRTEQGVSEALLKQYDTAVESASQAQSRLESLAVMEALLDRGMPTGRVEELTQPMRRVASAFGIANAERLGQQELFTALSNKMALEMKEGMTGPMSDRDILFLQRQVPQVGNTPAGNRLLIEVLRRFAQRRIEVANEMDRYFAEKGNLIGVRSHLQEYVKQNPMSFGDLQQRAPWREQ